MTLTKQSLSAGTLFWVLLISGAFLLIQAQEKPQQAGLAEMMASTLPPGVENKHFILPQFDAQGRRSSIMQADVVRRVDEKRLYAEKFSWQQEGGSAGKNLRIELPTAFYDLQAGVLRGTAGGRVSRSDFQIRGERMIYDTQTGQGMMQGNIRMVIFDTLGKSDEKPAVKP